MSQRFRGEILTTGRYTNQLFFPLLYILSPAKVNQRRRSIYKTRRVPPLPLSALHPLLFALSPFPFQQVRPWSVSTTSRRTAQLDIPQRVQYKLAVTVHRCLRNQAPTYLIDYCVPVSDVDGRRHLRSASRLSFLRFCWSYSLEFTA